MKLLVTGGTRFVGRHIVQAALDAGHEAVLFNRGQTNPELFPETEKIHGDRAEIELLEGRCFDAVIDVAGYLPRLVASSARVLRPTVDRYVFISSVSVYADFSRFELDEEAPVEQVPDPSSEDVANYYGVLKALCEQEVHKVFGSSQISIRPGLVVGPYDHTNRFTYWVKRVARGGRILAPAPPDRPVQFIDVRDLARWTMTMTASDRAGVFNVVSEPLPFEAFLHECAAAAGTELDVEWVDPEFLVEQGVAPWEEIPLWMPPDGTTDGLMSVSSAKAVAAGLTFMPVHETIADTLEWARSADDTGPAGLDPDREAELLQAWDARVADR